MRKLLLISLFAGVLPLIASAGTQTYDTQGAYTFTVPQDTNSITVEVWGAGGGGGGGGWSGSFGGGGGGYSKKTFSPSDLPSTVTVTVGSGGVGGGTSAWTGGCYGYGAGYAGSPGAGSSFGSYVSAGGGNGGGASNWSFWNAGQTGGAGGAGTTETGGVGGTPGTTGSTCDQDGNCTSLSIPGPAGSAMCAGGGGGGENPNWTYASSNCAPDASPGGVSQCGGTGGASAYAKYWCKIDAQPGTVPGGGGGGGNEPISNSCSQMYAASSGAQGASGEVKITWASPPPTCSISFDQDPLTGDSTTIHWTSSGANLFYINGIGYVSSAGSAQVYVAGDYSGSVQASDGQTATCSAILDGAGNQCVAGGTSGGSGGTGTITTGAAIHVFLDPTKTSWVVPSDWNNANNMIEAIGGGAGGISGSTGQDGCNLASDANAGGGAGCEIFSAGNGGSGGSGGGAGAYSRASNVSLSAGASVSYTVGGGGSSDVSGGDTFFCNATTNCGSLQGAAVIVGAQGGKGNAGGSATAGVGSVKYSGGSASAGTAGSMGQGGDPSSGGHGGVGGSGGIGGGAAGPSGAGSVGVGDAGHTALGANGTEFDSTHGSGGGGGGYYGSGGNGGTGGNGGFLLVNDNGGSYGSQGQSGTAGGSGRLGVIAITYVPLVNGSGSGTGANGNGSTGSNTITCGSDGNLHDSCGNTYSCGGRGCSAITNQCKTTCSSIPVCDTTGTKLVNTCTGATVEDCSSENKICKAGMCTPPILGFVSFQTTGGIAFTATGHLQIIPALVRSGTPATLYWNVSNAKLCAISGSNGDSWTSDFSGSAGQATRPITGQTTFTLHCLALTGATPPSIDERATVNVIPGFQEL